MFTLTLLEDLISNAVQKYNEVMEMADPRSSGFPFMNSPGLNLLGTLTYLFIVTYAGPKYMKNKPAFNLRKIILVYNIIMVIFSTYIFYEFLASGWYRDYSFVCQQCNYSTQPKPLRMVRVCYLFWTTKYIEFLDTFFFIARKKFDHVSFLHVFHHSLMAFTWWWGVKFSPGGLGTFHALINSFVHMVMYSYYAIASMGPNYQHYLWWKKYLTGFQMTQFVVVFSHMLNIMIFHDCKYPVVFKYLITSYGIAFLILFANFWYQSYVKKGKWRNLTNQQLKNGGIKNNQIKNGALKNGGLKNGFHKKIVVKDD